MNLFTIFDLVEIRNYDRVIIFYRSIHTMITSSYLTNLCGFIKKRAPYTSRIHSVPFIVHSLLISSQTFDCFHIRYSNLIYDNGLSLYKVFGLELFRH